MKKAMQRAQGRREVKGGRMGGDSIRMRIAGHGVSWNWESKG